MSFDLDIDNYKLYEIEEIFQLPKNYTLPILDKNETKLRNSIIDDPEMEGNVKQETLEFIAKAKTIMINKCSNKDVVSAIDQAFNVDTDLKQSTIFAANGSNFVIEKDSTQYAQSYPSEYYPGVINPLKKRVNTQYLNIDSRFRSNYYNSSSSNFHVDLPNKFSNVMSMQMTSIETPTTFYAISQKMGNNFFKIILESSGTEQMITITDGNYTRTEFIDYLKNFLTVKLVGTDFADLRFMFDGSSNTNRMLVGYDPSAIPTPTDANNFTLDFQCDSAGNPDLGTPLPLKLGWLMGFRQGKYSNNVSYVSEAACEFSGPSYMYLVIDDFKNNVNNGFYSAFTSSVLNKNILARIPITPSSGLESISGIYAATASLITPKREYFGPVDVQKMQVQLLDEYGRVLDLHNSDFSFCITFDVAYDV